MSSSGLSKVSRAAMIAVMLQAMPGLARAQGFVSGVVALQERAGAGRGDMRQAVVYLVPRAGAGLTALPVSASSLRRGSIAMRGREFIPHVRIVLAGGAVGFPNEDPFSHNVFSNVDLGPFDLGLYRRGTTRSATFPRAGIYPIYCNIHSKMVSFVVAVPTALATQPDADGRFTIRDVPAGTYVVHAWHERGSSDETREIVVPPGGVSSLSLAIDAHTYVDAPHFNKFGKPYALIRDDRY